MFEIKENISLAPLTTLKIGGKARFFMRAENEIDVFKAFEFADAKDLEVFILGGGSNVLIADEGFDGLVLQIAIKGIELIDERLIVGAGEDWDNFVEFCVKKNLAGIECLSGIPGFVGGTPIQNVGAYGQEVSETIVSVKVFDRKTRQTKTLSNHDCCFEYRKSIFNTTSKNQFIVLGVTYRLIKNGAPKIVYQDLKNRFGETQPTLVETRRAVLEIRRRKSMVIDENDPNSQSAGSFFKNPLIENEHLLKIETKSRKLKIIGTEETIPYFNAGENKIKIPAAWLIERAGFQKGFTRGRVGLSTNHTLALINRGDATAQDLLELKNKIQNKVAEIFDIELTPEPVFVGFEP